MPGIKKYEYPTETIGFRIKKSIKDANETPNILKDLGKIFAKLATRWTDREIEQLLAKHPLGSAIIEVIPE